MSELKAYKNIQPVFNTDIQKDAVAADDYDGNEILFEESDEVYFKSEADKVIADKDKEIAELQKEARHSKYKRCLAMAKLCHWKMGVFIYKEEKSNFYHRWHKRWLAIAEKFKTNSTAQ